MSSMYFYGHIQHVSMWATISLLYIPCLSNNGFFCVGTTRKDKTVKAPVQDISNAVLGNCCAAEDKGNEILTG